MLLSTHTCLCPAPAVCSCAGWCSIHTCLCPAPAVCSCAGWCSIHTCLCPALAVCSCAAWPSGERRWPRSSPSVRREQGHRSLFRPADDRPHHEGSSYGTSNQTGSCKIPIIAILMPDLTTNNFLETADYEMATAGIK